MIGQLHSLPADLLLYAAGEAAPAERFEFATSEIGMSLLQLAAERIPPSLRDALTVRSVDVFAAARQFVAQVMLSPASNHFVTMGVPRNFQDDELRDNYRRLIALVHPDARPEGFPNEAASKVNLAYSTLSSPVMRTAYISALDETSPSGNATNVAGRPFAARKASSRSPPPGRIRSLFSRRPQFRKGLLIAATLLSAPLAFILLQTLTQPTQSRLVEARPRLSMTTLFDGPISHYLGSTPEVKPAASPAIPLEPAQPLRRTEKLSTALSARPMVPLAINLAPVPSTAYRSSAEPADDGATAQQRSAPIAPRVEVSAPAAPTAPPLQAVMRSVDSAQKPPEQSMRATASSSDPPMDLDDVLLRFAGAYESGSVAGFEAIFAPGMTARRDIVADYNRVFQTTRQRQIRFNKLRHASKGDRMTTTGYANVISVDLDNVATNQRVFIEIDTRRIDGTPRIERLNTYVIQ